MVAGEQGRRGVAVWIDLVANSAPPGEDYTAGCELMIYSAAHLLCPLLIEVSRIILLRDIRLGFSRGFKAAVEGCEGRK